MSKVYQMRLLDGSDLSKEWIEVSESEYHTPLKDPSLWEKRILYTVPSALPEEPSPAMLYAIWAHRQDMRGASENDIALYSYLRLRQVVMGTAQSQSEWERPSKYGFKDS